MKRIREDQDQDQDQVITNEQEKPKDEGNKETTAAQSEENEVLVWNKSSAAKLLAAKQARVFSENRPADANDDKAGQGESLLDQQLTKYKEGKVNLEEERKQREKEELEKAAQSYKPLLSAKELANSVRYDQKIETGWRPPKHVRNAPEHIYQELRESLRIVIEGEDVPPPIQEFRDFRFPHVIQDFLKQKGIKKPTPIQIQGLPCILSGRDMLGIAFTGSGKTLVFALPAVLFSLQEELKLPLQPEEGPIALILCPSRELARQTWEIIQDYCRVLYEKGNYPMIRALLCIGGVPMGDQLAELRKGMHIIVATPGRLTDMLNKKKFPLKCCKFLTLDEADRLVEDFEEEVRTVIDNFSGPRQTLLFSATMPRKIQEFAKSALTRPIEVNVGRAGAVNLDVIQEVEYVKQEDKLPYILSCLQKTAPPVLIFCENKKDVDLIHEYLLLKGVDAVAIHGSKDQSERDEAIRSFKAKEKDVLVATDVASKGLDFPDIRHVINYDLPEEIENYVHRIGRTGRCGKRGVATTFINSGNDTTTLCDLAHLLIESKQRVPEYLSKFTGGLNEDELKESLQDAHGGCSYCGGPGHTAENCEKRLKMILKNRPRIHKDITGDF